MDVSWMNCGMCQWMIVLLDVTICDGPPLTDSGIGVSNATGGPKPPLNMLSLTDRTCSTQLEYSCTMVYRSSMFLSLKAVREIYGLMPSGVSGFGTTHGFSAHNKGLG